MRIKKAIKVPERVSQAIFELPIVSGVAKGRNISELFYSLINICDENSFRNAPKKCIDGIWDRVYCLCPGEWICQTYTDEWIILSDEQYKEMKENGEINV